MATKLRAPEFITASFSTTPTMTAVTSTTAGKTGILVWGSAQAPISPQIGSQALTLIDGTQTAQNGGTIRLYGVTNLTGGQTALTWTYGSADNGEGSWYEIDGLSLTLNVAAATGSNGFSTAVSVTASSLTKDNCAGIVHISDASGNTLTGTTAGYDLSPASNGSQFNYVATLDDIGTGTSETFAGTLGSNMGWKAVLWVLEGAGPTITAQPTDQTAANGATAGFSITATGATSYQWQRLAPGGGSWTNVSGGSGGTTNSYTTPTLSRSSDAGAQYRCQVSDGTTTVNSNPALLRVTAIPTSYPGTGLVVGSPTSFIGTAVIGAGESGAPYSLVAAQGSYALAGQAAGLQGGRRLVAAQGTYALNGQAAGLQQGRKVGAGQGSYTLSGQAATLRLARRLVAAQGAYALTGQAAGLKFGHMVAAAQGSYALAGQAAGLTYTAGAKVLTAAGGSYTLTGQAQGLLSARRVTAVAGSYSLSGQVAGLRRGLKFAAVQGAYALAGQTSALRLGRALVAVQGAYSLAGQAVALRHSARLLAVAGSYVLSGQAAGLNYSAGARILTAAAGAYVLSGQVAGLRTQRRLVAAQGSLALVGQAAGLRAARRVSAGQGSYVLSGQPAALRRALGMAAAAGAYSLVGVAARLVTTRRLVAVAGGYVLVGQNVGLAYSASPVAGAARQAPLPGGLARPSGASLSRSTGVTLRRR